MIYMNDSANYPLQTYLQSLGGGYKHLISFIGQHRKH